MEQSYSMPKADTTLDIADRLLYSMLINPITKFRIPLGKSLLISDWFILDDNLFNVTKMDQ